MHGGEGKSRGNPIALRSSMCYMVQAEGEAFSDFVARLRVVAAECQYSVLVTWLSHNCELEQVRKLCMTCVYRA